jgi:hypothetical protein
MRFGIITIAGIAVLSTSVLCLDAQASSVISELGALITDLPAIVEGGGLAVARELASLVKFLDPRGVVSDLPGIFSVNLRAVESFLADFLTAAIPAGAVPTGIIAEIPLFMAGEGSLILSDLDALVTKIPGTLSISDKAFPSYLASLLPELGTDIEGIASAILINLSKSLASTTAPANSTASTTAPSITSPTSTGGSPTTSNTATTFTGAAATMAWKAEIAGVVGFAAVVALL